jgi:trehalose/maltose transport system substrate-binding protein
MRKHLWLSVALSLILAMMLSACGGAAQPTATTAAPAATTAPETGAAQPTEAAGGETAAQPTEAAGGTTSGEKVTVKFMGAANGVGYDLDKKIIEQFTADTGIQVEFIAGPESATDRIAQYLQFLGAKSGDLDVYQIDVIWPGILAEHMVDLNESLSAEAKSHFPAIVANNTVDGKLIGMPFFTDAGLLYYRTDLLEKYGYENPPATWDELEEMAAKIQAGEREAGMADFWGFVWQGQAYEGLTCAALEIQASHGGGTIVEPDGKISVNNPNAAAAFERAAKWVGTISPPGVTGYQEEDARGVWQAGNAAFMRNWPYAYASGQADDSVIKDKFAVTQMPMGTGDGARHADTLGGWQLAVSKYSKHPEEAIALVKYLTSPEVQLRRSVEGSYLPTIESIYEDEGALKANPYYTDLKAVFAGGAVARPSTVTGERYNEVSTAYFTAVHSILTGEAQAADALADLEKELQDILQ